MSAKHSGTHSALPFAVGSGGYNEHSDKYDVVITSECRDVCTMELYYDDAEANAAYIVRACNAHETLTDVLTTLNTWLIAPATDAETIRNMREMIQDALRLAQGEQP